MMGSGKSTVGRRLASHLRLPFVDSDAEVEAISGCSITALFQAEGEAGFRRREREVIARLVHGPPKVISTGGGAFMDADTRALLKAQAVTIWLRANLDLLVARVSRRTSRPLLQGRNPREVLEALSAVRDPVYAEAHLIVNSEEVPHHLTVRRIAAALARHHEPLHER